MTRPSLLLAALLVVSVCKDSLHTATAAERVMTSSASSRPNSLILFTTWAMTALLPSSILLGPAAAEPITGLPYLTDADTVTISGTRIRLAGIDAPERKQTCLDAKGAYWKCGEAAREALTAFAAGKTWACELKSARDRYKRRVGVCAAVTRDDKRRSMDAYHGSIDINRWLVRSGWALDYRAYSHGAYAADQEAARVARRGLWVAAFYRPWEWRHRTCATTILGAVSVPIDAREKLCRPAAKKRRSSISNSVGK